MELLLNLAWILLAIPAWWLWRTSRSARAEHRVSSAQCLMALACALVILFPVISATDDLMAMRTEMEESPLSKRSMRQASDDKSSLWNSRLQTATALAGLPSSFALAVEHGDLPSSTSLFVPAAPVILAAGRAPPTSCLG